MAECHPVGFQWVMEAKRKGATIIHVDPRFTRTSAMADLHVALRPGSDIAFLGGIVNYILENELWFDEYVKAYTNASAIILEEFQDTEDLDGFFSGWDAETNSYDPSSWNYEGVDDPTLQHPRCVFRLLRKHFSRYTPEVVEEICGVPMKTFVKVAEALTSNSGPDRTSAFCYAVGWTQHSVGVQYIRTAAIIQLLLGNMGRPGGGILALRGHASIQGSTDIPTLFNLLPGYLPMPHAGHDESFESYISNHAAASGWWGEFPKYAVSLLKAYFGDAATKENDWCYDHLPLMSGDHSTNTTTFEMVDGKIEGMFVMGQNPVVGSMNGPLQRKAMRQLKWCVVRDFAPTETAEFWRDGKEYESGEMSPADVETEVFFFPSAAHTEKAGSFTNTQRLLQWRHKAIDPPGDCRSEFHFMYHLGRRLKNLYAQSELDRDRPIRDVTWDYPASGEYEEPDAEAVLREINGYTVTDGKAVGGFTDLADDGSTACGCWIYSGCYAHGLNQTARRKAGAEQSWVASEWGWAWPSNRRILYNRASADPEGNPWSERKAYVWWDAEKKKWTGHDVPDCITDRAPDYRPDKNAAGPDTLSGMDAFIMQGDGKGWLFVPSGLTDGPMPTHYEPQESVTENLLYAQQSNPVRVQYKRRDNPMHKAFRDPAYPYAITTYRLTEHHTAGGMSRWLSWLSELQPEMFCEISPSLAQDKGLSNGDWATITTARAEIECRVLVTHRIPDMKIRGRMVQQIGLPYHWGSRGRVTGDSANDLIGLVADPNVFIQESKVLTGNIVAGRRKRGA